jgi:hypothetical protein
MRWWLGASVGARPLNFTVRRQGVLMTLCDYLRATLLAVLVQTLAACATENIGSSGGANSDAATISGDSEFNFMAGIAVVMKEVDGVPVHSSTTRVSVAPGHHKLIVKCEVITTAQSVTQNLEIDVVPKGTYRLGAKVGGSGGLCEAMAAKTN